MTDHVYTLKDGSATYDSEAEAVTVAEAKAAEEDDPVTVCRKTVTTFEDVVRVHPDGSRERLDG